MCACANGQLETAQLLLRRTADFNAKDFTKKTALLDALTNRYEDVAIWLMGTGHVHDPDHADKFGQTGSSIAIDLGLPEAEGCLRKRRIALFEALRKERGYELEEE